jgi:hypothetical protein
MRIRAVAAAAALALVAAGTACTGGRGILRQYEYEEELYISLDGTATMYVNASIPALNALRGTSFNTAPNVQVDRDAVRHFFETPATRNVRLNVSLRSNRRFVHVKMDVDDVQRLGATVPFGWSRYVFSRQDGLYVYRQAVGTAAGKEVGAVGWNGDERVSFRLHLPSRVVYQNTSAPERGNILVWDQALADRARSVPLNMETRIETQSILYRTLWLFGATFVAVAMTFAVIVWWVLRRRPKTAEV